MCICQSQFILSPPYSLVTVSLFSTSVIPNYRGITSSVRMVIKNLQTLNAGEGVEKRNPPTLLIGMYIGTSTTENSMEVP